MEELYVTALSGAVIEIVIPGQRVQFLRRPRIHNIRTELVKADNVLFCFCDVPKMELLETERGC